MQMLILAAALASAPTCASAPGYHDLDFALGAWTSDPRGHSEGNSMVSTALGRCAFIEKWSAAGEAGENVDAYDREDGHWYRIFVNTNGQVHVFRGIGTPSGVHYTGTSVEPNGKTALNDLTIRRDGDSRVHQTWKQSRDGGKTWTTVFEGIYTRTPG